MTATRSRRSTRPRPAPRNGDSYFHPTGLVYFWVLNDDCTPEVMEAMLDAFVEAGAAAVCLHPRCGLRVPYGGTDWFDLIRDTTRACAARGLQVWLYDEDPYPSGACGGRVFIERPEFEARAIELFEHNPKEAKGDNLFYFPIGNLIWCGMVNPQTGEVIDLTDRVGTVRRKWTILEKWDSRFYYPATPLYTHPRSWAEKPEYAVRFDTVPEGLKLVAFVARPCGREAIYAGLPDSLNPDATRFFLQLTHEKYKAGLGDLFGKEVAAIFTDEPKFYSHKPWTPGMMEDFERQHGYDLRPRLYDLFSSVADDRACLTRLHFRGWVAKRFETAWLQVVSEWCRRNKLRLVGHISPEDEPVEQAGYVGNLHPLFKHFDLAGIDLIIPAVGDKRHSLINVGIATAAGVAAQFDMPGVMSETLGASGLDPDMKQCGKVLVWQTVMGLTSPVVHYAQNSIEGLREYDAPPDFGPFSPRWPAMQEIQREVARVQPVVREAAQVAPVAILWNVRSFWMQDVEWQSEPTGMRDNLVALLAACLDRQVGTHILDEATLWDADTDAGEGPGLPGVRRGRARYSHVLVPSCTVLHAKTLRKLRGFAKAGGRVFFAGQLPTRQQTDRSLEPLEIDLPSGTIEEAVAGMPRLLELEGDATDVRCTAWVKQGRTTRLLMNLREERYTAKFDGRTVKLAPGQVEILEG